MELERDTLQQRAIDLCCDTTKRLVCVTGAAGTGKTTIIKLVADKLRVHGYSVALAAPTGKAAKRITEATGIKAMTLHRLLEYTFPGEPDPETGLVSDMSVPRRVKENPLAYDVVIVDEYAMVNTALHRNLMEAIPANGCVRCFGDVNQLPPIEDNGYDGKLSPFQTLLKGNDWPLVVLTNIYRQGEGSLIVSNGARILRRMAPMADKGSFAIRVSSEPMTALMHTLKSIAARGTNLFDGISHQIITPQRIGKVGSLALNKLLCEMYATGGEATVVPCNPWDTKRTGIGETTIAVGQKVIITKNIYDLRPTTAERWDNYGAWVPPADHEYVFNGESGTVRSVDSDAIAVDLGDRVVIVPPYLEYLDAKGQLKVTDARTNVEHGYAITTHKAQGSEYEGVVYFVCAGANANQCIANYYTGITRARRQVLVVGDQKSLSFFSMKAKPGWGDKKR